MHFSFFHLQVALWRGLGCDGGGRQGGNGGENCQQFLKEAGGAAAQQQGCAKMNTDFRFPWLLLFIFWVRWDQGQGSSFAEISTIAQIELGLLESLQSCRY